MSASAAVVGAALGLLVGPLLRVAIDQVPDRRPLLRRRSPADGEPLQVLDLVPVASWTAPAPAASLVPVGSPDDHPDGGRATVRRRWRAVAIDLSTAVVLALLAARIGPAAHLPALLVFGATVVVVTVIDLDHYRIPDRVVFPSLALSAALLAVAAAVEGLSGALVGAAAGALCYFGFLFVFFLVSPSGMGFGDVKLALLLGLHLGWMGTLTELDGELVAAGVFEAIGLTLIGAFLGSLLGVVVGVVAVALRGRRAHFPFGPALCLGALVAVLFSESLA